MLIVIFIFLVTLSQSMDMGIKPEIQIVIFLLIVRSPNGMDTGGYVENDTKEPSPCVLWLPAANHAPKSRPRERRCSMRSTKASSLVCTPAAPVCSSMKRVRTGMP